MAASTFGTVTLHMQTENSIPVVITDDVQMKNFRAEHIFDFCIDTSPCIACDESVKTGAVHQKTGNSIISERVPHGRYKHNPNNMKKHILKLLVLFILLAILLLVLLRCSKVPSSTSGDGVIPEENAEQETADHQESSDPQSETEKTEQADDNEDELPLVIVPQDEPVQKAEEDSVKAPAEDTTTEDKATESKPADSPQQPSETPDSPETPAQPETPAIPEDLPQDEDELPLVPAG